LGLTAGLVDANPATDALPSMIPDAPIWIPLQPRQ
jgi:hypothetical protein